METLNKCNNSVSYRKKIDCHIFQTIAGVVIQIFSHIGEHLFIISFQNVNILEMLQPTVVHSARQVAIEKKIAERFFCTVLYIERIPNVAGLFSIKNKKFQIVQFCLTQLLPLQRFWIIIFQLSTSSNIDIKVHNYRSSFHFHVHLQKLISFYLLLTILFTSGKLNPKCVKFRGQVVSGSC